ncbi:unnamed protein product, partial [Amoebophrya sp. A25]|eukprot:GSA25T00023701001.1
MHYAQREPRCQRIFDFDDDNELDPEQLAASSSWATKQLRPIDSEEARAVNVYPYFKPTNGQGLTWPRGFPQHLIRDASTHELEELAVPLVNDSHLAVIQSLANVDPDVDAVYRQTHEAPSFSFQRERVKLGLGAGYVAPWNAQATLVMPPAFFGLLLPASVSGRVSDIWRSYITTRLLWATKWRVGICSPMVTQYRNPHLFSQDFEDELKLYLHGDSFVESLLGWNFEFAPSTSRRETRAPSLRSAYLSVMQMLARKNFLSLSDVDLAGAWVTDLEHVGWKWPEVTANLSSWKIAAEDVVDRRRIEWRAPDRRLLSMS